MIRMYVRKPEPLPQQSRPWHARPWMLLCLLLLSLVVLAACGRGAADPEVATAAETAAPGEAAGTEGSGAAEESAATPEPPVQAAPTQDIIVPPPDIAEPGPVSTIMPMERNEMYDAAPEMEIDPSKYYYATFKTMRGDIKVQLFADRAPQTVNNFVFLARQGFYDNTSFHRVLDGFMAQAGDPTGTGAGGPGYQFADEIFPGLVFDRPGLLAMANSGPGTNGSQFFITFAATDWLNGGHTIFGEVIEGEEVLSRLTRRDPSTQPDFVGDELYTVLIEESDTSILPTPTASPPTATPTTTPTPYAPTSLEDEGARPLATVPAEERVNYFNVPPEMIIDTALTYTATISTSKGDLVVRLYDDEAPTAVNNFVVLANLGYYDQTPVSLVQPNDSIIIGAPDNNPLNDAGYKFPAEIGKVAETNIGAITYIPVEQTADGTILSSSSQLLIALVQPPAQINAQLAFFGQVVEGVDVLPQLTTEDTIESITITSE
ncbi:MAG: peptidylprolyl isomerase [Caldilineaceae bacterium]|nr:peptidylprolyl isomerase [Caldilineaceae bacterium]